MSHLDNHSHLNLAFHRHLNLSMLPLLKPSKYPVNPEHDPMLSLNLGGLGDESLSNIFKITLHGLLIQV